MVAQGLRRLSEKIEDMRFARDEARLARRAKDYPANRVAVMEYGVAHRIPDIGAAYDAWRKERA